MAFIAFEGIDGSGKTTLSHRVVERLRKRGLKVFHARENGQLASPVASRIRDLARDAKNLALRSTAELLLYAAREAQMLEEVVQPALDRGELVVADRSMASHFALAHEGRGLDGGLVRGVLALASRGVTPDLVVLVDVDPHVARGRRRCQRAGEPAGKAPSRKGAAGPALQWRIREGLLRQAGDGHARWLVVENSDADLDEIVATIEREVLRLLGIPPPGKTPAPAPAAPPPPAPRQRSQREAWLMAAFFGWIERRARREPELAAHFLTGLLGDRAMALRRAIRERAPAEVARSLAGLEEPAAWELRRALLDSQPEAVARSLGGMVLCESALAMKEQLATRAPAAVASVLEGCRGPRAHQLRRRLGRVAPAEVLESLEGLDDLASWELRESLWDAPALLGPLVLGLGGLGGERVWKIRRAVMEIAPLEVLRSLGGLDDEESWGLRRKWGAFAPRVVLRSITGMSGPTAWALRRELAPVAKEALDSLWGMNDAAAWELRDKWLEAYPSTAVASLGPLAATKRGEELLWAAVARWPRNISLLRHAVQAISPPAQEPRGREVA